MMKKYILLISILASTILFSQTTDVITNINFPGGVVTNNSDLYVSDWLNGIIYKYDLNNTDNSPVIVANNLIRTYSLHIDNNDLYFCDTNANTVYKIDITQTNPTLETVANNLNGPYGVFVHNNILYVANHFGNTISKLDLSNSNATLETFVTNLDGPFDLAVVGTDLYFTQRTAGKLSKVDLNNPTVVLDVLTNLGVPSGLAIKDQELFIAEPYLIIDSAYLPGRISKINTSDPNPNQEIIYQYSGDQNNAFDHYGQHLFIDGNILYIGESYANKVVSLNLDNLSLSEYENKKEHLKLYPNPANDYIQTTEFSEILDYKIYNSLGQNLLSGKTQNNMIIDISSLDKGVYLIQFSNDITKRFIKN
ncbi:MAG: T9SS type A sorting domain-containing protein [Flavobacteriaceae bacterium]|nr:T9SS type A sorting domain-containing protein [Flavobacteriaceae bacterium]